MKAFARRAKDLADIPSILDRNPGIDVETIRAWLALFDEESTEPPYLEQFDDILRYWRKHG